MKINPNPWFADHNPPRNLIEGGYRPLTIDTLVGDTAGSSATLGAALLGDAASFDFSRLIQAIVPAPATPSPSAAVDVQDGVLGVLGRRLEAPLVADEPMPHLLHEGILDTDVGAAMLVPLSTPAPVVSAGALADLNDGAQGIPANTLALPLATDDPMPSLSLGRIPDLGFLQNLPATVWLSQPGFDQSESVIRLSDSAGISAIGEPVAIVTATRSDLIHELTSAAVADATVPLSLLFEHDDAGAVIASDLFVTDPALLPDFGSVQFAAVLPDPIVDPGPLV